MCAAFSERDDITSPKQESDLLIAWVSFNLSPVDPEDDSLSDPARSIRLRVDSLVSCVTLLIPLIVRLNTL
jgi:hypothetical protein